MVSKRKCLFFNKSVINMLFQFSQNKQYNNSNKCSFDKIIVSISICNNSTSYKIYITHTLYPLPVLSEFFLRKIIRSQQKNNSRNFTQSCQEWISICPSFYSKKWEKNTWIYKPSIYKNCTNYHSRKYPKSSPKHSQLSQEFNLWKQISKWTYSHDKYYTVPGNNIHPCIQSMSQEIYHQ